MGKIKINVENRDDDQNEGREEPRSERSSSSDVSQRTSGDNKEQNGQTGSESVSKADMRKTEKKILSPTDEEIARFSG